MIEDVCNCDELCERCGKLKYKPLGATNISLLDTSVSGSILSFTEHTLSGYTTISFDTTTF